MIVMHRCILNETWFSLCGIKLYGIVRESEAKQQIFTTSLKNITNKFRRFLEVLQNVL